MSDPDLSRAASYAFDAHLDARLDRCELTMPEVDRIEQGFLAGFDAACDAIRDGVIRSPMGEVVMHPPPGLVRAATGGKVDPSVRIAEPRAPGMGPELYVPPPRPRFIVAELSTSWELHDEAGIAKRTVGDKLEEAIAHNLARGYVLHSWRLSACAPVIAVGSVAESAVTETIVAVFELDRCAPKFPEPSRAGIVG